MFVINVKIRLSNFVNRKKRTWKQGHEQSKKKIQKVNSRLYSFQQILC